MNIIAFTGRLTANAELKQTTSGKSVTAFTVAVQRPYTKDKTDFINVVAWEKLAEFVTNYFGKGEMIAVDGYLTQRTYEDNNGNKRTVYEVIANNCGFCGKNEAPKKEEKPTMPNFEEIKDGDDLPF